jgi:hypothetical protein
VHERSHDEAVEAETDISSALVAVPSPAAAELLTLQRTAGNRAVGAFLERRLARQPTVAPPKTESFAAAKSIGAYIDLIREAEKRLMAHGLTTVDSRIQVLSEIYYGTTWSLDYAGRAGQKGEQSTARNFAFQVYTARSGPAEDPRPILGMSLFNALLNSQDVSVAGIGPVDVGHLMIGLNSRASWTSRSAVIPTQGATGLEAVTWVGDLGGAAARLARDRRQNPNLPASAYFSPRMSTDYGATSNLEGDIAAYIAGASAGATGVEGLSIPADGMIADALAAYFGAKGAPSDRMKTFLQMVGGSFTGSCLTNRGYVEGRMADKFEAFGRWYMGSRYGPADVLDTASLLPDAAKAVAHEFVEWLIRRIPGGSSSGADEDSIDRARRWLGL